MFLPLLLYWDGVTLGQHTDTLVCLVMGTERWGGIPKKYIRKTLVNLLLGLLGKNE